MTVVRRETTTRDKVTSYWFSLDIGSNRMIWPAEVFKNGERGKRGGEKGRMFFEYRDRTKREGFT